MYFLVKGPNGEKVGKVANFSRNYNTNDDIHRGRYTDIPNPVLNTKVELVIDSHECKGKR